MTGSSLDPIPYPPSRISENIRKVPDMAIIMAAAIIALALFLLPCRALLDADRNHQPNRLTVADIQARLAAETPRIHVPISRGV